MATCVPVKDLRDTATFLRLVEESRDPITVTKNGYDKFVAIKSEDYQDLCDRAAANDLMARMLIAEQERATNDHIDAHEALTSLKARHGSKR
jgi:PHD/YefM family antitoxin component YafN of YafNO toxin-antitoxin module